MNHTDYIKLAIKSILPDSLYQVNMISQISVNLYNIHVTILQCGFSIVKMFIIKINPNTIIDLRSNSNSDSLLHASILPHLPSPIIEQALIDIDNIILIGTNLENVTQLCIANDKASEQPFDPTINYMCQNIPYDQVISDDKMIITSYGLKSRNYDGYIKDTNENIIPLTFTKIN